MPVSDPRARGETPPSVTDYGVEARFIPARAGNTVEQPGRLADIYIFAWHPETRKSIVDHREPEQWTFFVLRTETLPAVQRSISLARVERLARIVRAESLAPTVKQMLKRGNEPGATHI